MTTSVLDHRCLLRPSEALPRERRRGRRRGHRPLRPGRALMWSELGGDALADELTRQGWRVAACDGWQALRRRLARSDDVRLLLLSEDIVERAGPTLLRALAAASPRRRLPATLFLGPRRGGPLITDRVAEDASPAELRVALATAAAFARRRGPCEYDEGCPAAIGGYLVEDVLGRGGVGIVYLARDPHSGQPVALKTLRPKALESLSLPRFEREVAVLHGLEHRHLVRFLDHGLHRGLPYYAMEWIRGPSLSQAILGRPWGLRATARLLFELADALAHIHARGIVHRDIKPENILLSRGETPVLMDFGLARRPFDAGLTHSGAIVGTPQFIAPEVLRGEPAGPAADLFALGMVALEVVSGGAVYPPGTTAYELMRANILGRIPAAAQLAPQLPLAFLSILDGLVADDPQLRPSRADDLRATLLPWLGPSPREGSAE